MAKKKQRQTDERTRKMIADIIADPKENSTLDVAAINKWMKHFNGCGRTDDFLKVSPKPKNSGLTKGLLNW